MPTATRKKAAIERLDDLRAKLVEAEAAEREIADTPRRLHAEDSRLARELAKHDLPIDGSPPPAGSEAGKLWRARVDVQERLRGPWDERAQEARRKTLNRRGELASYIESHLGELVAEIEPDARDVVYQIEVAAAALLSTFENYGVVAQRVSAIVGEVQALRGDVPPSPPFGPIRGAIERLLQAGIHPPLPRSLYAAEDPTIRAS
jgi:hypothetical protein